MSRTISSIYTINTVLLLSLLSLSITSFLLLISSPTSATDFWIDDVTISVPMSCTLSGTGMGSHNATITNGTYTSEIGITTLKATCNDNGGFAIYAIGYTGDQYTGEDHTKLIGTSTNQKIVTGTATTAGNPDVSNWAMKLATNSGASYPITIDNSFGSYSSVPDTYTKVAHRDSATDVGNTAIGSELTTTYAAYIKKTQPSDLYTGKVKYTLVHPANEIPPHPEETASGYIAYYPNTAIYEGSMSDSNGEPVQQLTNDQTSATLIASNFSKDGYGFAGWSDAFDYETNSDAHFYGPNEDITFTAGQYTGSNPGLSLYAVWVKSEGYLQDSDTVVGLCGDGTVAHPGSLTQAIFTKDSSNESIWSITADLSSVSALTDKRDGQAYAIAKLSDGKCWMIENLRIEAEATRGSANEALAQGYGKYPGTGRNYGNFIGLADAESTNFDNATANSIYSKDGSTEIGIYDSEAPSVRIPRYNHINTDSTPSTGTRATSLTKSTTYSTTANDNIYSYGNYYNWPAAKANTNRLHLSTNSNEANTSICPNGWHLPTGTGSGEFGLLSNNLGGYKNSGNVAQTMSGSTNPTLTIMKQRLLHFPNNIIYSGNFSVSSSNNKGTLGVYWSGTANSDTQSYTLSVKTSNVYPGNDTSTSKFNGYSVRCIAD